MMEQSARREIDVPAISALKGHTNFEPSNSPEIGPPHTHREKRIFLLRQIFNQKKKDLRAAERRRRRQRCELENQKRRKELHDTI